MEMKDMATRTTESSIPSKSNTIQSSVASSICDASRSDSVSSNPHPTDILERALTQTDLSPNDELAHRTRTNRTARTNRSLYTIDSRLPEFEVDFEDNDPKNPLNWPLWYRGMTIAFMSFATWSVIIYSTSYTSGMPGMMADFGMDDEIVATTGVTAYLLGLAVGSRKSFLSFLSSSTAITNICSFIGAN